MSSSLLLSLSNKAAISLFVSRVKTLKVHSHERQLLRLRVRLRQDDNIVSMRMLRQT